MARKGLKGKGMATKEMKTDMEKQKSKNDKERSRQRE